MTKKAYSKFIEYIDKAESMLLSEFNVSNKSVEDDGVLARVSFDVGNGIVEFLYGPPEFHVEIFISVNDGNDVLTRYDLAKLMTNNDVKNWVIENRPDMSHGNRVKAEVDWFILLLKEIGVQPEFSSLSIS